MIKLKEILNHSVSFKNEDKDNEKELDFIENWPYIHYQHLKDMGFEEDGQYKMSLINPKMSIFRKNKKYYVSEPKKNVVEFDSFNKLINFFDTYKQYSEN